MNLSAEKAGDAASLFRVHERLARVLEIKGDLGIKIKRAYDKGDNEGLSAIVQNDLPLLKERVLDLKNSHREMWMELYKPFGWEVLDIRYGGLASRLDTAILRISDYLEGRIKSIPEIEEERLYFSEGAENAEYKLICMNNYSRMVTTGII